MHCRQRRSVKQSPDSKGPGNPVPEPPEKHGEHEVQRGAHTPAVAASQGKIEIVAQPGGEGDMPARPEFPDRCGQVRPVEVVGQLNAEELADAHGNVSVSGKIEEKLERVTVDPNEHFGTAIKRWRVKDAVHQIIGQVVGDEKLLNQT